MNRQPFTSSQPFKAMTWQRRCNATDLARFLRRKYNMTAMSEPVDRFAEMPDAFRVAIREPGMPPRYFVSF